MLATAALATFPTVSAADSARAVATVYTVSLLATVPMLGALIAAWSLRNASAEGRVLVWRCAVVTLLAVFVGRQLPLHWMAWVVPSALATPLVELGRVEVAPSVSAKTGGPSIVQIALTLYVGGVLCALLPTMIATIRARSLARRAAELHGDWRRSLDEVCVALGVRRAVRLVRTEASTVPMTWGAFKPVIVIPDRLMGLDAANRRIVLLHELEHVRSSDWLFGVLGRLMCAMYWFHPAAWWIARQLRGDAELACDDRVIAAGTRRSDYAELLIHAADRLLITGGAMALAEQGGLRARLTAVLDARHDVHPLARRWVAVACVSTLAVAGPMSAVQLAPTRAVLTTLMNDARWESRAYAVLGLAQRQDSVAVARSAAELDPNPRVRAWARYALGDRSTAVGDIADLGAILHTR